MKFACLEDALDTDDVWDGIRGGMSPTERRALRKPAPAMDDRYALVVSRTLAGYSDEAIARELGVHVRTVYRIRRKAA